MEEILTYRDEFEHYLKEFLTGTFEDYIGKNVKYSNVNELTNKIVDYFAWAKEQHRVMTKTGLCLYLGVGNPWINSLKERGEVWNDLMEIVDNIIVNWAENSLNTDFRTASFLLERKYGYVQQQEIKQDLNIDWNNIDVVIDIL